jgi:hypothetical protein
LEKRLLFEVPGAALFYELVVDVEVDATVAVVDFLHHGDI